MRGNYYFLASIAVLIGTVVDYGCFSPTGAFVETFADEGVHITHEQARGPMGIHKRAHIAKLLEIPSVLGEWQKVKERPPGDEDFDRMYAKFTVKQKVAVKKHAKLIPGVTQTCTTLRKRGIKIGSCTGFATEIVDILKVEASNQGYTPDCYVAADEVPAARPLPHMIWLNAIRMNVAPIQAIVKVDDTVDGIREGISAGCWTVGVTKTGNYMALTEADVDRLAPEDLQRRLTAAQEKLWDSGAHYVIDSVAELMPIIDDINRRLATGEKP